MKKTLFSGIQPTGELHIGNYLGALKQWVSLQNQYHSIFCVVDLHSLTEDFVAEKKQQQILRTAIDFLSAGINPKKSIVFVQSCVPQHSELTWIFNCLTPISELERMTQYKDKASRQKQNVNIGLFDYPILMAADILLYQAEIVPVGEDQVQHVELARIVARKFNNKFGRFFPEPQAKLVNARRIMSLSDPAKKMSKSLGEKSYIALSDSQEVIANKIKTAVTGDEGGKSLLALFKEFSAEEKLIKKFEAEYKEGTVKYSELKPALAKAIFQTLKPIQEKRAKLSKNPKKVQKILEDGAKRARKIAEKNMQEIKKLVGLS